MRFIGSFNAFLGNIKKRSSRGLSAWLSLIGIEFVGCHEEED